MKILQFNVPGQHAMLFKLVVLLALAIASSHARSHEFWLEPVSFMPGRYDNIAVELRNGENFSGEQLSFRPDRFKRFTLTDSNSTRGIQSQPGELPAMTEIARVDGLHIVRYESTPNFVTYTEFSEFEQFVQQDGLDWVLDAHQQRKLSEHHIREVYSRYAKSLLAVESGKGQDRALGMEFELVALTQPYQSKPGDTLDIELRYRGQPSPGILVSVFNQHHDNRLVFRTDQLGRVQIPRASEGKYLVSAVMMRKPSALRRLLTNADWESLWASLTFELPGTRAGDGQLRPEVHATRPQLDQSGLFQ